MIFRTFVVSVCFLFLSGCATMRGNPSATQLELRVAQLERKIEYKDEEIKTLKYSLQDLSDRMDEVNMMKDPVKKAVSEARVSTKTVEKSEYKREGTIRVDVSVEDVQKALQNAGHYQGPIDGKIGNQTKFSIAEFQKDHNLTADGIVGKRTWMELEKYLQ